MARTRDEALHARRRDEILAAAAAVFRAKGFHLARTEDICEAAGLSAGTLFRHFPDKRSMIQAIAERELEGYRADLERLATRAGIEWLSRITGRELAELLRPRAFELGTDSWLELAREPESRRRLLAFDRKLRRRLRAELERGREAGWVRSGVDCTGATNLILALFAGLQFDVEIGLDVDPRATARTLGGFVRSLLAE